MAGRQPQADWHSAEDAASDVPTLETLAAAYTPRRQLPNLVVRVVTVVDVVRPAAEEEHPHGLFDRLFTEDRPVIFTSPATPD